MHFLQRFLRSQVNETESRRTCFDRQPTVNGLNTDRYHTVELVISFKRISLAN